MARDAGKFAWAPGDVEWSPPQRSWGTASPVLPSRASYRVGPHGYVHGWIKVGPDGKPLPRHSRVTTNKGWLKSAIDTSHRQELKAETAKVRKRLSPAQRKTVEQWTAGKGMVRRIQTGKVSKDTADAFDQAMHEAPKVDGLVYRGVSADSGLAKLVDRMRPGTTLRLDEPVSTSIDPGQAASFGTYMFEIDSPAAAYISGIGSKYAYEQEAVLAPGQFKVVSIDDSKMHFAGHGVRPVRVVKLQDVSQGGRVWRNVPRPQLNPRAAGDDMDDSDRSDRFVQGDGPGAFYIVNGAKQPPAGRTAETPVVSTVHHPFGSPAGPGLWHHKGLQLPAYIQNVAHAFARKGLPESEAIARAVGVVRDWASGRAPGGGHVHPDVQAAAAKAIAEWDALKAASGGGKGRAALVDYDQRFNPNHAPAGVGGGQFTSAGGAGKGTAKSKPAAKHPAKAAHHPAPHHGPSAAEKHQLLEKSDAIRKRIHTLRLQLETLEKQQHAEAKAAKQVSVATAKAGHKHAAPGKGHKNPAHTGASKKTTTHHKSLADRISDLRAQIKKLRQQADELEAQAGGREPARFAYDADRPLEHRYYDGSWG